MRRDWSGATVRLVTLALAIWLAALDPFQMNSRFDSASQAAADRVVAPLYARERSEARIAGALALVTIDAATVRRDHAYPIAYDELAAVVQAAADAKATAVFLDLAFFNRGLDPKGAAAAPLAMLVSAINAARAAGVPVFTGPIDTDPALDGLRDAVSGQAAVTWPAEHPLDYPFVGADADGRRLPLPATLLFRSYCAVHPSEPSCTELSSLQLPDDQLEMLVPLAIQFGRGPAPEQHRFTDPDALASCGRATASQWTVGLARGVQQGALGPSPAPCSSHLEIPIQDIAGAVDLIGGRLLVVGLTPELGDGFLAPGVGRIAGGAVHLMAVDNLIHYGADYPRWPEALPRLGALNLGALNWAGLFRVAIVVLIPIVIAEAGRRAKTATRARLWTIFALVLVVPLVGAVALGAAFHLPPGGIAALGLLSLGVTAFFEDEELVKALGIRFGLGVAACLAALAVAAGLFVAAFASRRLLYGVEAFLLGGFALSLLLQIHGKSWSAILPARSAKPAPSTGDLQ